jgi:hypothetical protein
MILGAINLQVRCQKIYPVTSGEMIFNQSQSSFKQEFIQPYPHANLAANNVRCTVFLHLGQYIHYDFNDNVGLYCGFPIRPLHFCPQFLLACSSWGDQYQNQILSDRFPEYGLQGEFKRSGGFILYAANLKSADRKLEWLEHRIEVIRSIIDMYAQDRTNRRLGRLTVLSMIFMPITFLAGVWGMNFEAMPLLNFRFGYLVALGVMLLLTGGMYIYFRRKDWFI